MKSAAFLRQQHDEAHPTRGVDETISRFLERLGAFRNACLDMMK